MQAFDLLLWVGNGQQAARLSSLSQPTISRSAHHVAITLGLTLRKVQGEWQVKGPSGALQAERCLEQLNRLEAKDGLRLEAGAISSSKLADPAPAPWVLGRPDAINQPRSMDLLQRRVIDAWLCPSALDLPSPVDPHLAVLELYRAPLRLVASPRHPLAQEKGLKPGDLGQFPSVALDRDWYPTSASRLKSLGLWGDPRPMTHYKSQHWEGRTADGATLAYASPLVLARHADLVPLDFDLGLEHRMALVVLAEHGDHPRIQELHQELQRRLTTH